MISKRYIGAASVMAMALCQGAFAVAAGPQDTPAPAASSAPAASNAADHPASVDESKPQAAPRYSAAAKNAGASGTVVVIVKVDAQGKPTSFHVMMSSGFKVLDDEAVRTVKTWSYLPAIKDGAPTDGYVQLPIAFGTH